MDSFLELQGESSNPLEFLFDICTLLCQEDGEGLGELKASEAVDVLS